MKTIDLSNFKVATSSVYTGRPQGELARKKIGLDELDLDDFTVANIKIPSNTTSFNPSFYLGLFFESIQKLGINKFNEKYKIEIVDQDPILKEVLSSNLEDGMRNAILEMNPSKKNWWL